MKNQHKVGKKLKPLIAFLFLTCVSLTGVFAQQPIKSSVADDPIAALTTKITAAPNDDKLYAQRAALYLKSGKFAEAIADADKAFSINPKNGDALFLRGLAKGGKKDYDGAIADFSQVIKVSPGRASAGYFRRGQVYEMKGDLEKALADYDKAAEIDPEAVEVAGKGRSRVEAKMKANAAKIGQSSDKADKPGAFTQADIDEFNKQNPNFGESKFEFKEISPELVKLDAENKVTLANLPAIQTEFRASTDSTRRRKLIETAKAAVQEALANTLNVQRKNPNFSGQDKERIAKLIENFTKLIKQFDTILSRAM